MFIAAAAAMLLMGGSAFAQSGTTGAYGTVSVPMSVTSERDMQVGDMQRGAAKTVDMGSTVPATNGTIPAQFRITGDQNDWYVVQSASAVLTWVPQPGQSPAPGDVTTMTGTALTNKAYTVNGPTGESAAANAAAYQLGGLNGVNAGESYLWIGATFTPAASQQRGNYQGTCVVTVAYN
jgi:hypothetical protein